MLKTIICARVIGKVVITALCLLGILSGGGVARAFDTGHHADLTRDALTDFGFSEQAIRAAQVENWLTDYFSSSPTSSLKTECKKLHFDNLDSPQKIRAYWATLMVNTRKSLRQAALEDDPFKALCLLSISLHAVQDFYTHSTWVETHPMETDYGTITWFDEKPADVSSALRTGKYPNGNPIAATDHGDYDKGINKDSYSRPNWDRAYVHAYAASRQWIAVAQQWTTQVDPAFWNKVRGLSFSSAETANLNFDLNAAYRLSEWVGVSGSDGHWKGRGSGSNGEFIPFAAAWAAAPDSQFVKSFKVQGYQNLLSTGLYTGNMPAGPLPPMPQIPLNKRAIIVRTVRVEERPVGLLESKIDTAGKADFYARITVGGQQFTETMQIDKSSVQPGWTTIKFVPLASVTVPIHYELWDEDGGVSGDDDHCDINSTKGKKDLDLVFTTASHLLSGDGISGVFDSDGRVAVTQGASPDKDRAKLWLYVTAHGVRTSGGN